jgi:hypothetical protein
VEIEQTEGTSSAQGKARDFMEGQNDKIAASEDPQES